MLGKTESTQVKCERLVAMHLKLVPLNCNCVYIVTLQA
jgi:hypothetical protein